MNLKHLVYSQHDTCLVYIETAAYHEPNCIICLNSMLYINPIIYIETIGYRLPGKQFMLNLSVHRGILKHSITSFEL